MIYDIHTARHTTRHRLTKHRLQHIVSNEDISQHERNHFSYSDDILQWETDCSFRSDDILQREGLDFTYRSEDILQHEVICGVDLNVGALGSEGKRLDSGKWGSQDRDEAEGDSKLSSQLDHRGHGGDGHGRQEKEEKRPSRGCTAPLF